ncbi:MAG: hypothetical protein AAB851_02290 [Patescibacteria group bacterium]
MESILTKEEMEQVGQIVGDFGITLVEFVEMIKPRAAKPKGFWKTLLSKFGGGKAAIPSAAVDLEIKENIAKLAILREMALFALKKEAIPKYLRAARNDMPGKRSPLDCLMNAEFDDVFVDLFSLAGGIY